MIAYYLKYNNIDLNPCLRRLLQPDGYKIYIADAYLQITLERRNAFFATFKF